MRAAFCTEAGKFELREVSRPLLGPGQVLVRVRSCGICGSDLHWFHGRWPPPPVCAGHEIAGEVVEIDSLVRDLQIGERVVVEPLLVCGTCPACRAGEYQVCSNLVLVGIFSDGGFAEYLAMPRERLYRLPPDLDFALGALTEPAAVCVHGVRLGNVGFGDRVLVLGTGTIGLFSVMAARAAGAAEIAVTARYPHQAEMARRLGATQVFTTDAEGDRERATFAADCPIDVVIETVGGHANTLNDSIQSVRPGGTVVVLGVFSFEPPCDALSLVMKEIRLVGALTYGQIGRRGDFEIALLMLAGQQETARDMVTHRFELGAIQEAFQVASNKQQGVIKVAVAP